VSTDFVTLTEISGDDVTVEQVERLARRYHWAAGYCDGRDVLEAACGAGQGVGYIASGARSVVAGDYSEALLEIARAHYGDRFEFRQFDAQHMPFKDDDFDVVLIFEALYYLPDAEQFFRECRRVLRPGGVLLISTANKDLYDFNPSEHSYRYFGVVELRESLERHGFAVECFGDTPVGAVSPRQRLLRPVKAFAARMGLIPKSMNAKKLLKRFVFGGLVPMPAEITKDTAAQVPPSLLDPVRPDRAHKVIFCAATLS
jgi:SAM-dependent methyltransferase